MKTFWKNIIIYGMTYFCFFTISQIGLSQTTDNCQQRDAFETEAEYQKRCLQATQTASTENTGGNMASCGQLDMSNMKKDSFETDEEYRKRLEQMINSLNQTMQKCQAGTASLLKEQYDIERNLFPIKLEWQPWMKELMSMKSGFLVASRDQAKALWGQHQANPLPLFVTVHLFKGQMAVKEINLVANEKSWMVIDLGVHDDQFNPPCDQFETPFQCEARKQRAMIRYNNNVAQHVPNVQAGVAHLGKYYQSQETFPMEIKWNALGIRWSLGSNYELKITKLEAEKLWDEGETKPVFVYLEFPEENKGLQLKPIVFALGKEWKFANKATFSCSEQCSQNCDLQYRCDNFRCSSCTHWMYGPNSEVCKKADDCSEYDLCNNQKTQCESNCKVQCGEQLP